MISFSAFGRSSLTEVWSNTYRSSHRCAIVAPLIESLGLCDPTRPVERRAWKRERIGTIIRVYATFTEHPTSWHRCEVNAIHHSHFPLPTSINDINDNIFWPSLALFITLASRSALSSLTISFLITPWYSYVQYWRHTSHQRKPVFIIIINFLSSFYFLNLQSC